MKPEITPLIIGAGGVASYLLPCLVRAFSVPNALLYDKDILEERNLDRQNFTANHVGGFKAQSLIRSLGLKGFKARHAYFTEATEVPDDITVIISLADNHPARNAAIIAAKNKNIPAIIAGNEYYDSQVLLFHPETKSSEEIDPREFWPEIATQTEGDPIRCTDEEVLQVHSQLAIANFRAASNTLDILWSIQEGIGLSTPVEIYTTRGEIERIEYVQRYNNAK